MHSLMLFGLCTLRCSPHGPSVVCGMGFPLCNKTLVNNAINRCPSWHQTGLKRIPRFPFYPLFLHSLSLSRCELVYSNNTTILIPTHHHYHYHHPLVMPLFSRASSPQPATTPQSQTQQQQRPTKCSYKTCAVQHSDTQHLMRRHTDVPYFFRHKGERVKFQRTGKEGDEERPYLCACQQIFHEQNLLAEHLFGTCRVYGNPPMVTKMAEQQGSHQQMSGADERKQPVQLLEQQQARPLNDGKEAIDVG